VGRFAVAVLALCLVVSGCARTGSGGPSPVPCRSLSEAALPDSAGTLDESSSGTYCLTVGQTVDVFLHGTGTSVRWTPIASSRPDVLAPQRTGVLTAPVGVTPGIFTAMRAGTAQLTSSQPNGPSWSVTVVVS